METKKEIYSYVQCLSCGYIYTIERKIPIEISVARSVCPQCEWNKGINCGDKWEDIYEFYDPSLDERYYNY